MHAQGGVNGWPFATRGFGASESKECCTLLTWKRFRPIESPAKVTKTAMIMMSCRKMPGKEQNTVSSPSRRETLNVRLTEPLNSDGAACASLSLVCTRVRILVSTRVPRRERRASSGRTFGFGNALCSVKQRVSSGPRWSGKGSYTHVR